MQQEMSEAECREEKQKTTYDQIHAIINRQLLDASLSQPSYNVSIQPHNSPILAKFLDLNTAFVDSDKLSAKILATTKRFYFLC